MKNSVGCYEEVSEDANFVASANTVLVEQAASQKCSFAIYIANDTREFLEENVELRLIVKTARDFCICNS